MHLHFHYCDLSTTKKPTQNLAVLIYLERSGTDAAVNMKILLATLITLTLCAVGMVPPIVVNVDVIQWTSGHFQSYAFR